VEIWKNLQLEDLEGEVWKPIKDYEGLYEISNMGRVKSLPRKTKTKIVKSYKILKINKRYTGYIQAKLCKNSKLYHPIVSRLVAEAFCKKPDYPCVVNHIDCIRHNNIYTNLEWITQSQNMRYAFETGRHSQKGERNNGAKITRDVVESIREYKKNNDHLSQKQIADHFGLKREHVKDIINYKTWN
jgi:predicted XRE-type DNA-binding protein